MQYTDQDFLQSTEQLYSLKQLDESLNKMASLIVNDYLNEKLLVIGIMNGALITAGQLLPKLNLSVDVDYCHATRYGKDIVGNQLEWLVYPRTSIAGRSVLLVDDIFDEGVTLKLIAEYCREQGAKDVRSAVLLNKDHQRKVDHFSVDYSALTIVDRYVFGFGLDYQGNYRNAPGIYVFTNEDKK